MQHVDIKDLIVGKEYVFGAYFDRLGFVPTQCDSSNRHPCRLVIEKVGRKLVTVRFASGKTDKGYDGQGFFEIEDAKVGYRTALKSRQANGYAQSDAEIEHLVNNL